MLLVFSGSLIVLDQYTGLWVIVGEGEGEGRCLLCSGHLFSTLWYWLSGKPGSYYWLVITVCGCISMLFCFSSARIPTPVAAVQNDLPVNSSDSCHGDAGTESVPLATTTIPDVAVSVGMVTVLAQLDDSCK